MSVTLCQEDTYTRCCQTSPLPLGTFPLPFSQLSPLLHMCSLPGSRWWTCLVWRPSAFPGNVSWLSAPVANEVAISIPLRLSPLSTLAVFGLWSLAFGLWPLAEFSRLLSSSCPAMSPLTASWSSFIWSRTSFSGPDHSGSADAINFPP